MFKERRALMVSIIELAVICVAVLWFTVLRDHRSEPTVASIATTAAATAPARATTTVATTVRKAPAPFRPPAKRARTTVRRPKAKPVQQPAAPAQAPKKVAQPKVAKPKVAKPKVAKPKPKAKAKPKATTVRPRPSKPVPAKPKPARRAATQGLIRLSAAHGDCWLSVHRGSQSGALLFEGTLVKGRVLTYDEPVWVRFGGASNMAVYVSGKQVGGLFGTVDAVLDRSGIHKP